MIISVHQPQYLPWLGFFDKINKSDGFVFLDQVQYKSREFQNRNKIRTKDGFLWLSVPVKSKGKGRQKISQVVIDNEFPWARQHLESLKTWYAKAKFFKQYLPFFEDVFNRKWDKLLDLNIHIINYLLKQLSITTTVYFESKLAISSIKTERIIQICKKLEADTYLSGIGGKDYLEEVKFSPAGIKLVYQEFSHPQYDQLFEPFIPFMSIVDLLFNYGPDSLKILKRNIP